MVKGSLVSVALPDGRRCVCRVAALRHSPVDFVELQPVGGGARISAPMSRITESRASDQDHGVERVIASLVIAPER
ncbi:hypothetical protein ACXVUM_09805 [Williamsia sp. SKLECPSW1]